MNRHRILIVDDSRTRRQLLVFALKRIKGVALVEAVLVRTLDEAHTRTRRRRFVDEQLVGGIVVAHVDVEVAITVNVDHRRAAAPSIVPADVRLARSIGEL